MILKEKLVERLEQRFITVGSLAIALSAFTDYVLADTAEDQRFQGRLGNDVYGYLMSGTDTSTDTGGGDELRVSVVNA